MIVGRYEYRGLTVQCLQYINTNLQHNAVIVSFSQELMYTLPFVVSINEVQYACYKGLEALIILMLKCNTMVQKCRFDVLMSITLTLQEKCLETERKMGRKLAHHLSISKLDLLKVIECSCFKSNNLLTLQ